MDFRNPRAGHNVDIILMTKHSIDTHLFAALHREGISSSLNDQNQGITVYVDSYKPYVDGCWRSHHTFIVVIDRRRDQGSAWSTVPILESSDPFCENYEMAAKWPKAGNLTRHQSRITSNRILTDSELVEEVVKDVYGKLYRAERVGIYSRLLEIESLLYKQPRGIRSIGIWGMPGIGKTTLVKAVFKHMSTDFDASCFIENFDEAFHKDGLHRLLENSIGKILEQEFGINRCNVTRPSLHREKLCDKMILLVLDDVRDSLAAQSFLGRLDWFGPGPGSVIIMTSIDKKVFVFCQTKQIYEAQGLNDHEALQLFSQNAWGKDMPEQNYVQLSKKVIDYATGNPLALSIFGQELKGKKSEMEDVFLRLKHFPPKKIHDALKKVYSALDDNEKNIILDIAFFFKGESIDYVVQMLDGCRYLPRVGIDLLVDKCVLTISENSVQMSNLIQDICPKIFVGEIESCTRMWEPNIIKYFLEDDDFKASGESSATPTCDLVVEDIESIFLDTANLKFDVKHDAFKDMLNLKFLKIYNSCSKYDCGLNFPKGLVSLPCGLRLLHWENYPMQFLPQAFALDNLVELCMPYSQLQTLGTRTENIKKLKRIRLCHSPMLVEFDRLLDAQNIELVDFQGCTRIQSFPDMSGLQHLRVVNLTGCTEIKSFQGVPPNIEELHLQGTSMREIPISTESYSPQRVKLDRQKLLDLLEKFQNVEHIDLENVTDLVKVSSGFGKLVHLNMKDCSHLRSLPDMVNLESLQVLHLSGCSKLEEIKGFPRNIRKLYIGGTALIEVPQLPKSLEVLNAHGCKYLKSASLDFEQLPKHYIFSNCYSFSLQLTPEFLASFAGAKQQDLIKPPEVSICLPLGARQISYFFLQVHPNAIFNLGPWTGKPICGFAMSVVVSFKNDYHSVLGLKVRCICTWRTEDGYTDKIERLYQCWALGEVRKVEWDHIFIFYDTQMHSSMSFNDVKFKFYTVSWENESLGDICRVSQCGVEIITAPTYDTIPSVITREVEATDFIEEHPSTSSRMLDHAKSPNRSEPRKVSRAHNKLRSKGTMLWKWVKTIRRDKKKKTLTDHEQQDLSLLYL